MKIISENDLVKISNLGDVKNIDDFYLKISREFKCTYLTYMVEVGDNKTYFSSNENWQKVFIENGLINHCPIYRNAFLAAENKQFVFTAWDHVAHRMGEEKDVMDLRMSFDIAHGLGLAIKRGDIRESLVFAGHVDDVLFHEMISNNEKIIHNAIKLFRCEFNVR